MHYSKYIIYLVFTTSFFQLVSAQDNSNSSSKGIKLSSEPKKKKSLLKPSNFSNPFLKKLKNKDVKDFFPDSDMNKNSSEDFIDNTKKVTINDVVYTTVEGTTAVDEAIIFISSISRIAPSSIRSSIVLLSKEIFSIEKTRYF